MNESELNRYLQYLHREDFPELLDDELPDHFDEWVSLKEFSHLRTIAREYARNHNYAVGEADQAVLDYWKNNFGSIV
ncbi:hypothetical protein LNKW23_02080 [Paralimibaculum aggregatum]|uniref:Uncharacterized protein n=1 Tax=Paralimibaculum aggregatum TaxID=3036245 RepID=A0ABQ6LF41_9RHOB|nr:hypothetical protein [Limibaculum sp. NKW23]GMG80996.1 hypothetical protein LNKW23_02080 [Limibaculum sp. NKW23]